MQYVQKARLNMKLVRTKVNYCDFKSITDKVIIVATIQRLDKEKSVVIYVNRSHSQPEDKFLSPFQSDGTCDIHPHQNCRFPTRSHHCPCEKEPCMSE